MNVHSMFILRTSEDALNYALSNPRHVLLCGFVRDRGCIPDMFGYYLQFQTFMGYSNERKV